MKILKKYIKEYAKFYTIAILALILAVVLDMISPQIFRHMVDDVIIGRKMELFEGLALGVLGIGVGRMIFQFVKEYLFDFVSIHISAKLRRELFIHMQGLDTSFFDKTNTGEIMARLKDDIDKIWSALCYVSMLIIEIAIHTVIIIYCMVNLNPWMSIVPILFMGICGFIAFRLEKKLDPVYEDISENNAKLNDLAEEDIAGVRTVKAFAREKYEIERFKKRNKEYCDSNIKQSVMFAKYYPYFSFVSHLLPLIVILQGGYFFMKGDITLGVLTAFVSYSQNIVWPMEMLGWLTNDVSSAIASYKKIKVIFDEESKIKDPKEPIVLGEVKGNITFENVGFHKEDMYEILSGISFSIDKGKTLGIMGATGSGKSSIISLLTRLYDATSGCIKLDGVDIRDLSLKELRGNISLVMQDVFLFSDTIAENIKMGAREDVTDEMMRKAAVKASANDFIERMEEKYDTVIGERGVGLSGGQKQRISIARAIAKQLPILIMDDSTSALDMETEHTIQEQLEKLPDVTKIIIAHRISSVKNADEILFLEDGKVAERGTHEELMKLRGLYYETYVSQYGEEEKQAV